MKKCQKCKGLKEFSEFHRNKRIKDGFHSWCKVCCKEYHSSEKGKAAHRRYHKSDKGKEHAKRNNQSEKGKARTQRYNETPKAQERNVRYRANNKERVAEIVQKYQRNNPEKYQAHNAVGNAIKAGKIPAASTLKCNRCKMQAQDYHHHLGYSKEHWFDLTPVCRRCHKRIHLHR